MAENTDEEKVIVAYSIVEDDSIILWRSYCEKLLKGKVFKYDD